ncbi:MAG TPA: branched-chain amino acid ABC transporter permease [Sediminispirochaeta sp.]|nr:branched-chain amino acid ABC transporter permease [Sediminispirochaeta sp.]
MELHDTITEPATTFSHGVKAGVSIALGYMPIALAFGLLGKNTGLSLIQTMGMSIFVFAGASQFMALGMIGLGVGVIEIVFSTFIVNIRHMLMSMTIHEKALPEPLYRRLIYAFGITDEVFAVSAVREGRLSSPFLFGVAGMAYSSWVLNSGLGFVAGSLLPEAVQAGMSIALYAMFIGLLIPSVRKHRRALFLALTAGGLNYGFGQIMASGWAIIGATVGAVLLMELFQPKLQAGEDV